MRKVGRNEPCPCGSGKKYKNCHMGVEEAKGGKNKALILGGVLLLLIVIGIAGYYFNSQTANSQTPTGEFTPGPPPPGPAPAGKVWSYEHGHWHDA